jgi:hypothetical protein
VVKERATSKQTERFGESRRDTVTNNRLLQNSSLNERGPMVPTGENTGMVKSRVTSYDSRCGAVSFATVLSLFLPVHRAVETEDRSGRRRDRRGIPRAKSALGIAWFVIGLGGFR